MSARFCQPLLALSALCATCIAAWAGPPFITDDPEPVDYLHGEFYVAMNFRHESEGDTLVAPAFEFNFGAAPNLQLHLIAPMIFDDPSGAESHYGYGDTELGVKYRFIHETENFPQVGVFPLVELPTGNEHRGLGSGEYQFFLPIWIQKSWGEDNKWTTYGGGGWQYNTGEGNRSFWRFGWELQYHISDALTIGGEIYHMTPDTVGGEASTGFNLGAIVNLGESHHILFSAGRDIRGPNLFSFYLAYQLTF